MGKILLKSLEEFKEFEKNHTGYVLSNGIVDSWLWEPDKFPCILYWNIQYDGNDCDHLVGDYVYPDDFKKYKK